MRFRLARRPRRRSDDWLLSGTWCRLYAWSLALYPRWFRESLGADMTRTFARRLAEARERAGGWGRTRILFAELAGLPFHAVATRLRGGGPDAAHDPSHTPGTSNESVMILLKELRHGARRLTRTPGFTIASIITLGLGIGATTAVYSLVHSTVISPLPYPQSDRLVWLDHAGPGIGADRGLGMTDGLYKHYAGTEAFEDMGIWTPLAVTLGGAEPERVSAVAATPSLFSTLRVAPARGRAFSADPGAAAGIVVSHGLWLRRFGGDPDAVGQVVQANGSPVEILGVMPEGFEFPDPDIELWAPLRVDAAATGFGGFSREGVARLAPGATLESATAELRTRIPGLADRFGVADMLAQTQLAPVLLTLKDDMVRDSRRALWILLGSVAFVLLLTCANVANLLLVRAEGRHRDTALRRALGAGRAELIRHFMCEGLLLSLTGGVIGVALAAGAIRILVAFGPSSLPRLSEVGLSAPVLSVAIGVSLLTAICFGLLPVLRGTPSLASTIKSGELVDRDGRARARGRGALVAIQVALALMLLIATGLMGRSFMYLATLDPGFSAEQTLTFHVGLSQADYPDRPSAVAFHRQALDRIAALPGVEVVGATNCLPLCGSWGGMQLTIEGRPEEPGSVPRVVAMRRVNETFFTAMRVPLVAGTLPTRVDQESQSGAAVISKELAEAYWPGVDPLGQRFRAGGPDASWYTVAAIVQDTPIRSLDDDPPPMAYLPLLQGEDRVASPYELVYVLRTAARPQSLLPAAREVVRMLDPRVPVSRVATMSELVSESNVSTAFTTVVLAVAAGIALLLGIVGIYGVVSYAVGRRAKEIGIRMALGARASEVRRSVLAQGGRVTVLGLVVGLAGALALTRVMSSLLFGVSPTDPLTFATVPVVLLLVSLAATYVPARRASRVDPVQTLRGD